MSSQPCSRCGHTEVLDGVRLKPPSTGGVDEVQAVVSTGGMIRRETGADLRARICVACGHADLFVPDPVSLAERWREGDR